ncbi:hypothetical protein Barb6XT_00870 [Bacteroidales bacterium Barb6XT]|nr:hypothetical protein Barb6XT_00870 [Bacteroidales bacterium Barb6XT]
MNQSNKEEIIHRFWKLFFTNDKQAAVVEFNHYWSEKIGLRASFRTDGIAVLRPIGTENPEEKITHAVPIPSNKGDAALRALCFEMIAKTAGQDPNVHTQDHAEMVESLFQRVKYVKYVKYGKACNARKESHSPKPETPNDATNTAKLVTLEKKAILQSLKPRMMPHYAKIALNLQ